MSYRVLLLVFLGTTCFSDVVYFITGSAWLVLLAQRRCWRQETSTSDGPPGGATEDARYLLDGQTNGERRILAMTGHRYSIDLPGLLDTNEVLDILRRYPVLGFLLVP